MSFFHMLTLSFVVDSSHLVVMYGIRFAVLDECTSAVSADGEENLYKNLQESGITLLSIAHRPALKK